MVSTSSNQLVLICRGFRVTCFAIRRPGGPDVDAETSMEPSLTEQYEGPASFASAYSAAASANS